MTNTTDDKPNLIHKRVIQWKHLKKGQDTNQFTTPVNMEEYREEEVNNDD